MANVAPIAIAVSEAIKLTGILLAEAKRTLPAAEYERLRAEQRAALAEEAAEEAAWTPVTSPTRAEGEPPA